MKQNEEIKNNKDIFGKIVPLTELIGKAHMHITYHVWHDYDSCLEMGTCRGYEDFNGFHEVKTNVALNGPNRLPGYSYPRFFDKEMEQVRTRSGIYVLSESEAAKMNKAAERIRNTHEQIGGATGPRVKPETATVLPRDLPELGATTHNLVIGMHTRIYLKETEDEKKYTGLIKPIIQSIPSAYYPSEDIGSSLSLNDILAKDAKLTASIYLGKIGAANAKTIRAYELIAHDLKAEGFSPVGEYCKCAKEDDVKKFNSIMLMEQVHCSFDHGFFKAIGKTAEQLIDARDRRYEAKWGKKPPR